MKKNYYSGEGLWKGFAAVKKLAKSAGVSEDEAKNFLKKQALWQIFLPPPKQVPRPHWTVDVPGEVHQADLLFLPHDKVGKGRALKVYKYALVVVDVASRFKDAEPLTSKKSEEVAKAFEKIYSRTLKWPKTIIVDPGSEFKGAVEREFERHGVSVQRSEARNHRAQAFAERANRTLGEKILAINMLKTWSLTKGQGNG